MDDLEHIIEALHVIDRENPNNKDIFNTLNFIINLLDNCDSKRLTKSYITRSFKLKRITVTVNYDGNK